MTAEERTYMGRRTTRHLKAVIEEQRSNAQEGLGDVLELVQAWSQTVVYKSQVREIVTVRWYRAYDHNSLYCNVAIKGGIIRPCKRYPDGGSLETSGHACVAGTSPGARSAALGQALRDAGVVLYGQPYPRERRDELIDFRQEAIIDDAGDAACREALVAILEYLEYRGAHLLIEH